jgi:hypothetical protein
VPCTPGAGEALILGLGVLGQALADRLAGLLQAELFLPQPGGVAALEVRAEAHDSLFIST